VHVSTSTDGGRSWSRAVLATPPDAAGDAPTVISDPHHAGHVYLLYANNSFGEGASAEEDPALDFEQSSDYGHTWSLPMVIATSDRGSYFGDAELSVLANGTLVATSSLPNGNDTGDLLAWHSTDAGRSWSAATIIRATTAGATPVKLLCGNTTYGEDPTQ